MTIVTKQLWRDLQLRSPRSIASEVGLQDLARQRSVDNASVLSALAELAGLGALAELSVEEISDIAKDNADRKGNVIIMADHERWHYFKVSSPEQLRRKLGARRETLRRHVANLEAARAVAISSSTAISASAVLHRLSTDASIVNDAKAYEFNVKDEIYFTFAPDWFARHWNLLAPNDRKERVKVLAILGKIARGEARLSATDLAAEQACGAEIERITAQISEIANDTSEGCEYEREAIPKSVQHEVWRRDKGCCVQCGSKFNLEFDHVIPVSKGGSKTARNIQLLCETCNRAKSNRI